MPGVPPTPFDRLLLEAAAEQAALGLEQGGIPIGAALGDPLAERVLAVGHNLREQTGDTTAHAEIACLRNAGRRADWPALTLATTLSPCVMCAGAILLHRIPRVVIGDRRTFVGDESLLASRGVALVHLDDAGCAELMSTFIAARPDVWREDIGEPRESTP